MGIFLAAWLGWLLIRPLLHPRTHLVLLSGDVGTAAMSLDSVPADYVVEDFCELLALNPALHGGIGRRAAALILGSLQNPDEMQHLADRLNERITGSHDVLILYVAAHGLTQDGDAWLLASGADPSSPLGGRYRLASLLAQLRECRAHTKVLLLDAGRLEYDPLRGLLENDFPTRLVEQVEQLGDPHLWVLTSHAAGQRSHVSAALSRSVFGYFTAAGLRGRPMQIMTGQSTWVSYRDSSWRAWPAGCSKPLATRPANSAFCLGRRPCGVVAFAHAHCRATSSNGEPSRNTRSQPIDQTSRGRFGGKWSSCRTGKKGVELACRQRARSFDAARASG